MPIASAPRQVLVVQRRLTHYRVSFFEMLRADLRAAGLNLRLAYGDPRPQEAAKRDSGELGWAEKLPTHYWLGGQLCWQPFGHLAKTAAVTILTSENKLVCNLFEQFGAPRRRVMLWGHGGNLQGARDSLRERFKAKVALRADWWLAYTSMSRDLVQGQGFPADRITVLENSLDTTELRAQVSAVTPEAQAAMRAELGLGTGPVGIYVGSVFEDKRIDMLLDAGRAIRAQVPGFELMVVGDGLQRGLVIEAAAREPWIKYLGVRRGAEKALLLSLSQIYVHPGTVGLAVLDSFVSGVPLVTTPLATHGPEVSYLEAGRNALITENTLEAFVRGCVGLLLDPKRHADMRAECLADGKRYTQENMSRRFTEGVLSALEAPIRRGHS